MASALSEALRKAAELQKRVWKSYEQIYVALGYSEFPQEHVTDAVAKGVEHAAAALGNAHERAQFFRARKEVEQKRARVVAEEDQCPFCGEPLDVADDHGVRECPECWTKFDQPVNELHL